jgi:hypothetical protein
MWPDRMTDTDVPTSPQAQAALLERFLDPRIYYVFLLSPWQEHEVTPFQGFAPTLPMFQPCFSSVIHLPGDLFEWAFTRAQRLNRRRSGEAGWYWSPLSVDKLEQATPSANQPFVVVFTAEESTAAIVSTWREGLEIPPLHVSRLNAPGAIKLEQLTPARLRTHCRQTLRKALKLKPHLRADLVEEGLAKFEPPEPVNVPLGFRSHGVTIGNELVLASENIRPVMGENLNADPPEAYVEAVVASADLVGRLRDFADDGPAPIFRAYPRRPDTILFSPSLYHGLEGWLGGKDPPVGVRETVRAISRQRGHRMDIYVDDIGADMASALINMRRQEVMLQSMVVGLRAASSVASVLRLPNDVNRTAGVMAQLADHQRRYADQAPPIRKTVKVFKAVQNSLARSVGPEVLDQIRASETGIKIVSDAPLEWLPVDGLPLGIRYDVSRINATPGNLAVGQLRLDDTMLLKPEAFSRVVVISTFKPDDPLRTLLPHALKRKGSLGKHPFETELRVVRSADELAVAVSDYSSHIVIIDGHGVHRPDEPGYLMVGDTPVDVWMLRGQMQTPPIVMVSACDTHPSDRNHATVASGFLSCGARAVIGAVLPVGGVRAADFAGRLMFRAAEFTRLVVDGGRTVPWTAVVSGALRMQLVAETVPALMQRGLIPKTAAHDLQLHGNMAINTPNLDWIASFATEAQRVGGFGPEVWDTAFTEIVATSDAIRYVHVGNPESILVTNYAVLDRPYRLRREAEAAEQPAAGRARQPRRKRPPRPR